MAYAKDPKDNFHAGQAMKYGKLAMSPKTTDVLFTMPKGWEKWSEPKKQIQDRRVRDRQRTLSRAVNIIGRNY